MEKEAVKGIMKTEKQKHGFRTALVRVLVILLILARACGAIMVGYALYYRTHYRIDFYQETSEKVSGDIRLAVISDIHNREYGENNERLISDLRALKPDLILFLGDTVTRDEDD